MTRVIFGLLGIASVLAERVPIRVGGWGSRVWLPLLIPCLSVNLLAVSPLFAQGSAPVPPPGSRSEDSGFLFGHPRASITLRGGLFVHRAGSDLYDFAEERFTVDRSDFRGVSLGIEGATWIGSSTDLLLGLDWSRVTLESEYRKWREDDESPIRQTTRITHGPALSFGVRRYLLPRGEQLGRFVWIPRRLNAFAGAGAALSGYDVKLEGDFVDEQDQTISTDEFHSDGHVFLPFLTAGMELSLTTRMSLVLERRYHWGSSEPGRDFRDDAGRATFEPIDLSGARLTAGASYRF